MTERSPMHQQIDTLPALLAEIAQPFDVSARETFDFETCTSIKRVYLTGCGDSFHASLGAELAFNQFAGVPTQALSALTFSRYTVGYLPPTGPKTNLVIAVSVSGVVSRTIEALQLALQAGAVGVALTGAPVERAWVRKSMSVGAELMVHDSWITIRTWKSAVWVSAAKEAPEAARARTGSAMRRLRLFMM